MKKVLVGLVALFTFTSCKKTHLDGDGCDVPPSFFFTLADNTGQLLLTSERAVVTVSYTAANQQQVSRDLIPAQLASSSPAGYLCADDAIAQQNKQGVHTFYLRFQGKTDTLGVQLQDECGYHPAVTFNGRPTPATSGGSSIPEYFVLRRR